MKVAYFTICSANYLAYAVTLAQSVYSSKSSDKFYIFLADEVDSDVDLSTIPAEIIRARDINIPDFWDMVMRYDVLEFNTAIKPFCIEHLFNMLRFEAAVYLDPDIYVVSPLKDVIELLEGGTNLVLTPHSLVPLDDGLDPDDVRIMQTGVYNLGFCAFLKSQDSAQFLRWWGQRLQLDCRVDLASGLFVDQKFMDLAPAYLDKTCILRNSGYNVAYWNLKGRKISQKDGIWLSNRDPLIFFHFSGVVPGNQQVFSKHQNRYGRKNIGKVRILLDKYLSELNNNRHSYFKSVPYRYNYQGDGSLITKDMRSVYRLAKGPKFATESDFLKGCLELCDQLSDAVPQERGMPITTLMHEIWLSRKDLQTAFTLATSQGRYDYVRWFVGGGFLEHGLTEDQIDWIRKIFGTVQLDGSPPTQALGILDKTTRRQRRVQRVREALLPAFRQLPMPLRKRIKAKLAPLLFGHATATSVKVSAPQLVVPGQREGVGLFGNFRAESGVGEGARRAYAALGLAGVERAAYDVGTGGVFEELDQSVPVENGRISPYAISLFHINADRTLEFPHSMHPGNLVGKYRIGYWAWELPEFPDAWIPAFDTLDEIWVPSSYVNHAVAQKTDKPVMTIPHPVPVVDGASANRAAFGIPEDAVAFLCTFDYNSYSERKNPFGALDAFRLAFADKKDRSVVLVIKTHGNSSAFDDQRRRLVKAIGQDKRVIVIDRVLSRDEMTSLQASCDVFVSLHRAEGFGLNIAECMAQGKPVISTGFSGSMEFTNDDVACLVDYSLTPVGRANYPFGEGQWWAEPDRRSAASHMVALAANPKLRRQIGESARTHMMTMFSYERIGRVMADRLNEIARVKCIEFGPS